MKTLLLILIFAFSVFGQYSETPAAASEKTVKQLEQQKKKFKFDERYIVKYDKFEDITVVRCLGFNMIGAMEGAAEIMSKGMGGYGRTATPSMLYFGVGFLFHGDTLKKEPPAYLLYFNYSGDQWKFLKTAKLIVLLDGEKRLNFGEGAVERDIGRRAVSELIGFKATKEDIQDLANAKTIEIKIGTYAKPLKKESQEMFANILKLADPAQLPEEKK